MRRGDITLLAVIVAVAGSLAQSQATKPASSRMSFQLTSPAFASGSAIPRQYTCEGPDESPEVQWNGVPSGSVTFALVMHDPDAPVGDWVHWVAWNIPSTMHRMPVNLSRDEQLPDGTRQGRNSFGKSATTALARLPARRIAIFSVFTLWIPSPISRQEPPAESWIRR
jgi:phosphatidylethanolamine-binding protein (PEBP) family uncharacterized protein